MMHYFARPLGRLLWWRVVLFALAALVLAATFMAYFNANTLVDFANLRLC